MAKLTLRFGNAVLQEIVVGESGIRIGRSPDNGLVIDSLAVSHHHAQVSMGPGNRLMLKDLESLNGTFVNGRRVSSLALISGDCVEIGKHSIVVQESAEMEGFKNWKAPSKPEAPKVNETMMLGTKERSELLKMVAAVGDKSQTPPARMKVPTLLVRKGKTSRREYTITDMLTVIGKSELATVELRGWFAPKVAAQINRRENDTYYIGAAGKHPRINGRRTKRPTKLSPGDVIDVAGVRMEFVYCN